MNNCAIISGPIIPMLIRLSLPIFIGMSIQLIYNVTDTFWISRIDLNDPGIVGGTGLVFPIMFLAMAMSNGLQTGISALTARSIGENNTEQMKCISSTGFFLAALLIVLVMVSTYLFSEEIMRVMGAKDSFFTHGHTYFRALIPAAVAMFLSSVFSGILQGEGKMRPVMVAMMIGTSTNLILDPIFIFPLKMGVRGAALATVIAQLGALAYTISYFKKGRSSLPFNLSRKYLNLSTINKILTIGIPQILSLAIMSMSNLILNKIVISVDPNAMAAFTLCSRFEVLQFIPILALSSALVTVISQNYGKNNFRRIRRVWRTSLGLAGITELLLALLLIIIAPVVYPFFSDIESVVSYAVRQTRTVNIFFTAAVFGILARSVFQGINHPLPGLLLTMLRLVFISVPAALLFVYVFNMGVQGVWYGIIVGSVIAGSASFIWTERVLTKQIRRLKQ